MSLCHGKDSINSKSQVDQAPNKEDLTGVSLRNKERQLDCGTNHLRFTQYLHCTFLLGQMLFIGCLVDVGCGVTLESTVSLP